MNYQLSHMTWHDASHDYAVIKKKKNGYIKTIIAYYECKNKFIKKNIFITKLCTFITKLWNKLQFSSVCFICMHVYIYILVCVEHVYLYEMCMRMYVYFYVDIYAHAICI